MKKEHKEKWLKALRSGDYKQVKEVLFDGEGYCCLGVLLACEQGYVYDHDLPVKYDNYDDTHQFHLEEELSIGALDYYGLDNTTQQKLVAMNDGSASLKHYDVPQRAHTFAEIADYIEKNL